MVRSRARTRRAPQRGQPNSPPAFVPEILFGKPLRFKTSAATSNQVITARDLIDLLCMASSSTAAYSLCAAVKVRRVEMWAPMASDLTPVTCSLEWASNNTLFGGNYVTHSDTSMGAWRPAHVVATPPARSISAMWHTGSGTSDIFTFSCPINTVIDVHLTFSMRGTENTSPSVSAAVSGASTGVVYCRKLDSTQSTPVCVPVSLLSI